jgi:signal-transduction protein with cAMP-binding, CBS, and nucleotidyltransferase domain
LDTAFLNLAYASYIAASLIPGGLKFRLGLVTQSLFFILWGLVTNTWSTVVWNVIFAIVNGAQVYRITRRNAVRLTEEEEACRVELFTDLSRRDFLVLWSMGSERQAETGWQLLREGTDHSQLFLLLNGAIDVRNASGLARRRTAYSFIGEMSFFSGEPASADIVAHNEIRYRQWNHDDLRSLQQLNPDCAHALQNALGRDAARKLRT